MREGPVPVDLRGAMRNQSRVPPTTYALILLFADGSKSRVTVSQAPGRLYNVGDTIEAHDATWQVAGITMGDRVPVLTCVPASGRAP